MLALTEQVATLAPDPAAVDAAVEARTAALLPVITAADASGRLHLGDDADKYAIAPIAPGEGPPCLELLPLCEARCCELEFALSSQDLDEGVVRWDHGQPYLIRHDDRGRCVHLGPSGCDCYAQRPAPCRSFDCRHDPRIWTDYARREPAPRSALLAPPGPDPAAAATRSRGLFFESLRLRQR